VADDAARARRPSKGDTRKESEEREMRNVLVRFLPALFLLTLCAHAAVIELPEVIELADLNSTASIDTTGGRGMFNWTVNGVDHLQQQWFWMRTGQQREYALDAFGGPVAAVVSDRDLNGHNDMLFLRYDHGLYTVEVSYLLTGGEVGSRVSDMAETIKITSRSQQPLDLRFFQYTNLNLSGAAGDDTVEVINASAVQQQDPFAVFTETVVAPDPSRHEVNAWPATLDKLEDDLPSILDNGGGPLTGDATWAFQWDFVLGHYGDTFLISKDKLVTTPEPATLAVLACGVLPLMRRRRRS